MKNFCAIMYIIIQNMFQYYITNITNVIPLKPKVMKLACTWKTTSNINETTIHYRIVIPLQK